MLDRRSPKKKERTPSFQSLTLASIFAPFPVHTHTLTLSLSHSHTHTHTLESVNKKRVSKTMEKIALAHFSWMKIHLYFFPRRHRRFLCPFHVLYLPSVSMYTHKHTNTHTLSLQSTQTPMKNNRVFMYVSVMAMHGFLYFLQYFYVIYET